MAHRVRLDGPRIVSRLLKPADEGTSEEERAAAPGYVVAKKKLWRMMVSFQPVMRPARNGRSGALLLLGTILHRRVFVLRIVPATDGPLWAGSQRSPAM